MVILVSSSLALHFLLGFLNGWIRLRTITLGILKIGCFLALVMNHIHESILLEIVSGKGAVDRNLIVVSSQSVDLGVLIKE